MTAVTSPRNKMNIHGTGPKVVKERRNKAAVQRRSEIVRSHRKPVRGEATRLHHCPHCGHGLSARYRAAGEVHLRRNTRPPIVCAWTP